MCKFQSCFLQLNTDGQNCFGHHDRLNHYKFWWVTYGMRLSQLFSDGQIYMDGGVITTFERQILLPLNGRNLKDDSHVISLLVSLLLGGLIFYRYL
jgi:hypothetical protein